MQSTLKSGAWQRHLLSTATALTFATGLGAGVLSVWLIERPAAPPERVATPMAQPPDDGLDTAPAAAPATFSAAPAAIEPLPAIAPPPAKTAPASTRAPELALYPDGLSRDAELAGEARLAKASAVLKRTWSTEQIKVRRGDTLMDILLRARVPQAEAHAVVESLRTVYDPRRLRAGQQLMLRVAASDQAGPRLFGLNVDLDFDHQVQVSRDPDGHYVAAKLARPHQRSLVHRAGTIDGSLYLAADRASVPDDVTIGLIKLFSWDVDFQRDVRRGDRFETLFEQVSLADGSGGIRGGNVLYAALTIGGQLLEGYRFELEDGRAQYFDRTGRSLRKFLMRTPIDGARLSSRFGMRKHPILGYSRMHKGVDFAAPTGTPVYAAGDGKVVVAKRNGGYGRYIRIRHSGEYGTAYAHLSRFAQGIQAGRRVRQGQVIGYVGTSGRSTGPHLHYEVIHGDQQINPLKLKQPANQQLAAAHLARFRQEMTRINRLRAQLARGTQLASRAH